jgi:hypothetical protein
MRLEQLTIIVMFLRNTPWSQQKLNAWVQQALAEDAANKHRAKQ